MSRSSESAFSEEIINNSVDLGQRHAYTVALTVLRSQPVEVAIAFIQKSLNDLQPQKTEVIEPLHSEFL